MATKPLSAEACEMLKVSLSKSVSLDNTSIVMALSSVVIDVSGFATGALFTPPIAETETATVAFANPPWPSEI